MDFPTVQQIMLSKSLATDPAFDDLRIGIEPIHRYNGCPLGLYFPVTEWSPHVQQIVPKETIVIPPESSEAVLLHELGHRHGHYYYGDLSEKYAEYFRKIYQPKGRMLLYTGNDFNRLSTFGALFEEGEKGAVEMALAYPLTPDDLYEVKSRLNSYGEPCMVCYGDGETPFLRVEFTQGVDWSVIIMSTLLGMTALSIGLAGYGVYKVAKDIPWAAPVLVLGSISAFVLVGAYRERIMGKVR